MWMEVAATRARGIPVVVSMGATAASGGYYISAPASAIVAQPGTLTGSIGVVGGKFVLGRFLKEFVGVNVGVLSRGKRAGVLSAIEPFSKDGRAWFEGSLDKTYTEFLGKVAMGRGPQVLLARAAALEKEAHALEAKAAASFVTRWGTQTVRDAALKRHQAAQIRATVTHIVSARRDAAAAQTSKNGCRVPAHEGCAVEGLSLDSGEKSWSGVGGGGGGKGGRDPDLQPLPLMVGEGGGGDAGVGVSEEEVAAVRSVAGGRVWTGEQAIEVRVCGRKM